MDRKDQYDAAGEKNKQGQKQNGGKPAAEPKPSGESSVSNAYPGITLVKFPMIQPPIKKRVLLNPRTALMAADLIIAQMAHSAQWARWNATYTQAGVLGQPERLRLLLLSGFSCAVAQQLASTHATIPGSDSFTTVLKAPLSLPAPLHEILLHLGRSVDRGKGCAVESPDVVDEIDGWLRLADYLQCPSEAPAAAAATWPSTIDAYVSIVILPTHPVHGAFDLYTNVMVEEACRLREPVTMPDNFVPYSGAVLPFTAAAFAQAGAAAAFARGDIENNTPFPNTAALVAWLTAGVGTAYFDQVLGVGELLPATLPNVLAQDTWAWNPSTRRNIVSLVSTTLGSLAYGFDQYFLVLGSACVAKSGNAGQLARCTETQQLNSFIEAWDNEPSALMTAVLLTGMNALFLLIIFGSPRAVDTVAEVVADLWSTWVRAAGKEAT